jgi:plastocyanin
MEGMSMVFRLVVCLVLSLCLWSPVLSLADNTIVIKNHQFNPPLLTIPAGKKAQITVENQDSTAEEFESFDLDREQVVEGNKKIIVFIGTLKPGTYKYWDDYHQDSKGVIVAQ